MIALDGHNLTLEQLVRIARDSVVVSFDEAARIRVTASRAVIETLMTEGRTIYGVNM